MAGISAPHKPLLQFVPGTASRTAANRITHEAERPRGLKVDDQLVLRRRLHRQVGWLLSLENAVNVTGGAPVTFDGTGRAGDQAPAVTK
jgi:hypothetical protein